MKKIREIVRLRLETGASVREIAAACSVGRSTVSEYVARITAANLSWPDANALGEDELRVLLLPPRHQQRARDVPDWNAVRKELGRKGVTLKLLWHEYISAQPDGYSYSRFVRMYRSWLKRSGLTMLQRHLPGEKLFVDWSGLKLRIVDSKTGEVSELPVFVAALGSSQYVFAKAYPSEKSSSWLAAHVEAFEFYGALPKVVVPDNLKTGVEKACRYEPETNLSYAELAHFYSVAVLPARARKPKDKAKVENAVQQVERWVLAPLRDRTFFTLEEANDAIASAVEQLNAKVMKGPGLSRKELFQTEDLPAMRPLPERRYSYAEWKRAKLGPDYHVEVEGHLYSVPFGLVGEPLEVRFSLATVEIFHGGKRVAAHVRSLSRRGFTTLEAHMPERHRKHAEWTPERMVRWAASVGPNASAFAEALLASREHPEQGYRSLMGTLRLEKQFGSERLDAACKRALVNGAFSYKSVRSILERRLEAHLEQPGLPSLGKHANIRGGAFYAEEEQTCAN